MADREVRRPAHLLELASAESRYSGLGRYIEWVENTDGRDEYHAFLRKRFAFPGGVNRWERFKASHPPIHLVHGIEVPGN